MLRKIFFLTVLMAAVGSLTGYSQTNTATASADAVMSLPVAVNIGNYIEFGGFMPGATPGTVVLPANPNMSRQATGGVTLVLAHTSQYGITVVSGEPGSTFTLLLPSDPVSIKLQNNPEIEMTLTNIAYFSYSGVLQLDEEGYLSITFGGTLNVGADQTRGDYTGSFEITAAYE
ncbi:MAG: hypothetical protein AMXMBFR49_23500 [Chlorobiota bacterium]